MKYYLFPSDFQFEPKEFDNIGELDVYCSDNHICVALVNENAAYSRFLFKRWNKEYKPRDYQRTFVGF